MIGTKQTHKEESDKPDDYNEWFVQLLLAALALLEPYSLLAADWLC
jgi:hypothetical protein